MANQFDPVPACFSGVGFLTTNLIERHVIAKLARWKAHTGKEAGFPIDIEALVEVVEGIEVEYIDQHSEFESDVLGAYDFTQKKLFVRNSFEHEGRRRFTWAHEYGHAVLHSPHFLQQVFDFYDKGQDGSVQLHRENLDKRNRLEYQANLFAGHILMPTHFVLASFESKRNSLSQDQMLSDLASLAIVSKQAAKIRLEQLGFIPKTIS